MKPTNEILRLMDNVDDLLEKIDPEKVVETQFGGIEKLLTEKSLEGLSDDGAKAIVGDGSLESLAEWSQAMGDVTEARIRTVEAGRRGMEKISAEGEFADLDRDEQFGVEAIILLTNRPALLIQRGELLEIPDEWAVLKERKEAIASVARSVGRIEVTGHPRLPWVGTGFLVADDVIMTNSHVAKEFAHKPPRSRTWRFMPEMSARIDYVEEFGVLEKGEFDLRGVIGIHDQYDMALFRVERTSSSGMEPPKPLTIASQPPAGMDDPVGRQVFACGYPAMDTRNGLIEMMRIFSNIFNVKRVQPGELRGLNRNRVNIVHHDCSTLGGNSGSCLVDLETDQVLALHFGGSYMDINSAVALWQLTDDPLLKKAGVHFA